MSERLWTGLLDREALQGHLASPREAMPFAIVESLTELSFPGPADELDPARWPKGRIFGEAAELRWVSGVEGYRVWLAGEITLPGVERELPHLRETECTDAWCYLWDKNEGRIGWTPRYAALDSGEGHPRLCRREYRRATALVYLRHVKMDREPRA
jgi:hypothetical protein